MRNCSGYNRYKEHVGRPTPNAVKVLLILVVVVAGGVFLLNKTGAFSFYAYSETEDANGRTHVHCFVGCSSAIVQSAEGEESVSMQRVRSVGLQTSAGEACRHAALRLLARRLWLLETVADELESG